MDGNITILVGRESTTIEIKDSISGSLIVKVKLTANQLSAALSRIVFTSCEIEYLSKSWGKFGKKMEMQNLEFPINAPTAHMNRDTLRSIAIETSSSYVPAGWEPDNWYNSKDSFFGTDGNVFARTTIRRWVEQPVENEAPVVAAKKAGA